MTFVHTAHGPGRIVATETMRGRTRHKVSGAGFEVWLDSTQVRTSTLGDINEDNSTTLPYDPEPQYPSDMWNHDSTIQPGEQEIDADERLSPSDSLSFDSAPERPTPGPNPDLFAKGAARVDDWREEDWSESPFGNDHDDRYRNHPDSWSHEPTEKDYADWEAKNNGEKTARRTAARVEDFLDPHADDWGDDVTHTGYYALPEGLRELLGPPYEEDARGKQANLGPKYASWLLEATPEGDDSISRFRRDPVQEINRLGYLWTGGVEESEMADYGRLVEADKQLRTAAWTDVRQKAQRLRREGRVHVLHKAPGNIYANVDGDHGTYSVLINKTGFRQQSIDNWACSCEWGKWAFVRKISYVGRLCSHGYATYLEMQSDQHKNNPGRFEHPFDPGAMSPRKRKTSATLSEFQDYVEDYRDGNVDIDAADNYISMPGHDQALTEDEVDEIYDWARENHTMREPRDYKQHYTAAENSDGAKVLRTRPRSMTPDLIKVPGPQDSYFVDVEEDERETTGPGQTMLSMVDAQGNHYAPARLWRTAVEEAPEDESGQAYSSDVATPRVPDSAPQTMEEETNPSSGLGSGFSMSDFSNVAGPVIDGVSQFAAPIAEGIGSAIGGIFSSRTAGAWEDTFGDDAPNPFQGDPEKFFTNWLERGPKPGENDDENKRRQGRRTADYYMDGPTNSDASGGELDHLRELSDEDPDYRNRNTQNRGVRDAVDCLREEGYDASPIVAALDYRDDESGPSYRDHPISRHRGNGMYSTLLDGKGMHSADTLRGIKETIDDHLDGTRREGSYGLGNQDAAPPGGAFWQSGGGSWADGVFSGSGSDPKLWRSTSEDLLDRGDEDIDEVDVTEGEGRTNEYTDSDRPAQGKSARRHYAGDDHEEPDYFPEDGGRKSPPADHRYEPDMGREGRRFYADDEEVRNDLIQATGEEIEGIGIYNDFLDDAEDAGQEGAAAAFRDTIQDEYKHVDQFSGALAREGGTHRSEAGMSDVVRRFQASGGGALASSGGGSYGDDDIAGQARKFLAKTAGRVYSLSEQQELVDESHPSGARNKPTEDDLAGTHYV